MDVKEGKILVDGHRVWYRQVGRGGVPLLTLHGGPGAGSDYLEPLESLSERRAVIFFDQLGCGRSDIPDDPSLWKIERFVREIDTVRRALDLPVVHLFGHSWGGWLAIEYMLTRPEGVIGLVLASTSSSIPQFVAEADRLKAALPERTYAIIRHYESLGDFRHPIYVEATMEFYRRHACRLDPWPDCVVRSLQNLESTPVYEAMNGPNEFTITGTLRDWDVTGRLGEIDVPTLVTVGRYDELTPACAETLIRGIPGARLALFEDSSHNAHHEERESYLQAIIGFMAEVESARWRCGGPQLRG